MGNTVFGHTFGFLQKDAIAKLKGKDIIVFQYYNFCMDCYLPCFMTDGHPGGIGSKEFPSLLGYAGAFQLNIAEVRKREIA